MKGFLLATAFVVVLACQPLAAADSLDAQGSRDAASEGVYSEGAWTGNFKISWEIKQEGAVYHYVYKITDTEGNPLKGDVSHLLLEVSPEADIKTVQSDIDVRTGKSAAPSIYISNENNPGLPSEIYAVQFDLQQNKNGESVVEFYSSRPPVWGDFYAQGVERNYAYNTGFGNKSEYNSELAYGEGDAFGGGGSKELTLWVPIPNTGSATIHAPEPATWLILGSTVAFAAYSRRRKLIQK